MLPASPSLLLVIGFVALVAVIVIATVSLVIRAGKEIGEPGERTRRHGWATLGIVLVWVTLAGALASSGALRFRPEEPPYPLFLFFGGVLLVTVAALAGPGRRLALGTPLWLLVGFQVFRLPVELLLHQAHQEGLAPVQMTYLGWNFDLATALTAVPMAVLISRCKVPHWLIALWNTAGLGLLVTVVTIAVLSAPVSFRLFTEGPDNRWLTFLPFVWLPTVLVPAALAGHLLVYRRLLVCRRGFEARWSRPVQVNPDELPPPAADCHGRQRPAC